MYLNELRPGPGAKKTGKRLGRGIGSGKGKTCGRGHKGQHARAGGYHKVGFEGGQMPIQRRLPKFGFVSLKALITTEIRLDQLADVKKEIINMRALKEAGVINSSIKFVKVIAAGEIKKAVKLSGLKVTHGARKAIETAGGTIED